MVKKADYDVKITDIKGKYFTATDYNKFTSEILDTNIKQTNKQKIVNESNISKLVKASNLNTKLVTLATKVDFFGDNSFQNMFISQHLLN